MSSSSSGSRRSESCAPLVVMEVDEEAICRYCFEGAESEALECDICDCRGDQRYVHLSCLRRWQRQVLVSQPTHPAFYEKDPRHYRCNVCKGLFTCAPPSRLELMSSFTGPELGALMAPGCIIASHAEFTAELARQMEGMPRILREQTSYAHWCGGVFLITEVEPLDPTLTAPLSSPAALDAVCALPSSSVSFNLPRRDRLGADSTSPPAPSGPGPLSSRRRPHDLSARPELAPHACRALCRGTCRWASRSARGGDVRGGNDAGAEPRAAARVR